jgi:hypothetical protein
MEFFNLNRFARYAGAGGPPLGNHTVSGDRWQNARAEKKFGGLISPISVL